MSQAIEQSTRQVSGSQLEEPWKDEMWLRERYWGDGMSMAEIAERCDDVTSGAVAHWMEKHEIPRRTLVEAAEEQRADVDEEWLRERYWKDGMSISEIAEECGLASPTAIQRLMKEYGIERRDGPRTGRDSPFWKEYVGCHTAKDGHVKWSHNYQGKASAVFVHRLVAVAEHGFEAVRDRHVHHENHIPWDNRPSNLKLVEPDEHRKIHYYSPYGSGFD